MRFLPLFREAGPSLLFLHSLVLRAETSSNQIRSLAISPDGKFIAVEFGNDRTSLIYKIGVDTGVANRLTDATTGLESGPAFSPDEKESRIPTRLLVGRLHHRHGERRRFRFTFVGFLGRKRLLAGILAR